MSRLSIETMTRWLRDIENTNQHIPLLGYLVMYDKGALAFGKVTYISAESLLLELPLNFFMKFCVNHDISLSRKFKIPIRQLEVSVKGRETDPNELLMRMVVNNLSTMRRKKKILKGLSFLIWGFDNKLEMYEEYYKELTKLEQMKVGRAT